MRGKIGDWLNTGKNARNTVIAAVILVVLAALCIDLWRIHYISEGKRQNDAGNAFLKKGDYAKARECFEKLALGEQGDLAGSRKLQEEAVAGFRKTLGDDHPDTIKAVENLKEMR
jgi:hypothetical protein